MSEIGTAETAVSTDPLRRTGVAVWSFTDSLDVQEAGEYARTVAELGYLSFWTPETFARDPFVHIAHLLDVTEHLVFATGIANIYNRHAGSMKQAAMTLAEQAAGRFVLGVGVSHERTVTGIRKLEYAPPLARMREFLDAYDSAPFRGPRTSDPARVLAALGPKMIALAAQRAAGVHTYSVTPAHTASTRAALGPDALLYVEQKVIVTNDIDAGLDAARTVLAATSALPNYRRRWLALGFSEEQISGLDAGFVHALVAIGSAGIAQRRVEEHLAAGATQVCIQPLDVTGSLRPDVVALRELAPARRPA